MKVPGITRLSEGLTIFTVVTLILASLLSLISDDPGALTFDSNIIPASDLGNVHHLDLGLQEIDGNTSVFVVYEKLWSVVDSHIMFRRSDDGGASFSHSYDLLKNKSTGNTQKNPAMASNNDTIVVAFLDSQWMIDPTKKYLLRIAVTNDTGTTFEMYNVTSPQQIGYPTNKITDIDVVVTHNGTIHVTWIESTKIMISTSLDSGKNWIGPYKVSEQPNPQYSSYSQKSPTVSSNGNTVVVVWSDDSTYKEHIYRSVADARYDGIRMQFSEPALVQKLMFPMPYAYDPRIGEHGGNYSLIWWDFITDRNMANNQDIVQDRPSILYSRSTNHGYNFTINGKEGLIVNSSIPDGWHSPGDLSVNDNGTIAVVWYDYTSGSDQPAVRVSTSVDGIKWSDPRRASNYDPDIEIRDPRVAIDSNGTVYTAWLSLNRDKTDWNLTFTRSITNRIPDPVDNVRLASVGFYDATILWDINTEPDFQRYEIHLSTKSNFIPSSSSHYMSTTYQGLYRNTFEGLMPNTTYYTLIRVVDSDGLISNSEEVSFITDSVNQPPTFLKTPDPIYMEEDSILESAVNLTDLLYTGFVWDDNFRSQTSMLGLEYDIEFESIDPNISAVKREIPSDPPSTVVDIRTTVKNWYGIERIRLIVRDAGADWAFYTPDDLTDTSDWFEIMVREINDPPVWSYFEDGRSGYRKYIRPGENTISIDEEEIFCREDVPYTFSLSASDVDNDFITFTCHDSRLVIKPDLTKDGSVSIFSFVPDNDDTPSIDLRIRADDGRGGAVNISLVLPVTNVNDPPVFESVDGVKITDPDDGFIFNITEGDTLEFQVAGTDIDPLDALTLTSDSGRIEVKEISTGLWNLTFNSGEDEIGTHVFSITLMDLAKTWVSMGITINMENVQDQPRWVTGKDPVVIIPIYDMADYNDWDDPEETDPRPEWGEPVRFIANAIDPDGDDLIYSWKISDVDYERSEIVFGSQIEYAFLPTDGDLLKTQEKFLINLTVIDGYTEPIYHYFQITVWSDSDNDNDGLPDNREIFFFGDLLSGPDEDPDEDGYTNIQEIGFLIPRDQNEIETGYPDVNVMDPTKPPDDPPPPPPEENGEFSMPEWVWWVGAVCLLIILGGLGSVLVISRSSARKDRMDDEDIERRVRQMEERQKEIQGLYGSISISGEEFGPDQSTLDDLKIDLGGRIYHSEGERGLIPTLGDVLPAADDSVSGGPLFQDTDSGPVMGESLEIETIDEE
ncbi:MAG: hypothetical protein ACMUIG_09435 [Thermoplasmatota archaeon]